MRKSIYILLLLVSNMLGAELPIGTVKVKAYLYDCTLGTAKPLSKDTSLLDSNMKLHGGIIGKGVELKKNQIDLFLKAFDDSKEFSAAAGCHIPHHGLVFYDKADKPIGYYEVCFGCGNVRTSVKAYKGKDIRLKAMKSLFTKVGFPILKDFKDYSALYKEQIKSK